MNRIDRILALFDCELSFEDAVSAGATPADALAAVSLVRLDLELELRAQSRRTIADARKLLDGMNG